MDFFAFAGTKNNAARLGHFSEAQRMRWSFVAPAPPIKPASLEIGDFIHVTAWDVDACVMQVESPWFGSEDARRVLLQESPDAPAREWRYYTLEPGQFEVL